MADTPFLRTSVEGRQFKILAVGAWISANSQAIETLADRALADASSLDGLEIDATGLLALDTLGAWQIERLLRSIRHRGGRAHLVGLAAKHAKLYERVKDTAADAPPEPAPRSSPPLALLEAIGRSTARIADDLIALLSTLGALASAAMRGVLKPQSFRLTSTVYQLDRVCWQALPLILLITFLIGCIIAQQGFFHFRKFGAEDYVVDLVGILVLREIGVLLVAIMVAGRSGSSYAAELGAMKMREELDALRTMGLDPVEILMLPRVVALVIAVPILTFLGSIAALAGGAFVAATYGGMSPEVYLDRLRQAISITHLEVGLWKAPFMALVIGAVACTEGMKVRGSAESLGQQTTSSVVKSIFLVIILDGLFAIFFATIGM